MEVNLQWNRHSECASHGEKLSLKISSEVLAELMLHALVNDVALKIISDINENRTDLKNLSIKASAEKITDFKPFCFSNVAIVINVEGDGEPYLYLNAVEASQYSSHTLATLIGQYVNIRWITNLNGNVIGEGIAHYYGTDKVN